MTSKGKNLIVQGVLALAGFLLVPAVLHAAYVFQDNGANAAGFAVLGALLLFWLIFALAIYIYMSLALQTIAKKTNTPNAWLAWIPIANIFLMLSIAKKEWWWFFLCLIPVVNLVILIIVWMAIAEARKKPNWWGILLIVPVANLIVPGYLAWSD